MPETKGYVPPSEIRKESKLPLIIAITAALNACANERPIQPAKVVDSGVSDAGVEKTEKSKKEVAPDLKIMKDSSGLTHEQLSTLEDPEHRAKLKAKVHELSKKYDVPEERIWGMIWVESKGQHRQIKNPDEITRSKKDAVGYIGLKTISVDELNQEIDEINKKNEKDGKPMISRFAYNDRFDSVKNLEIGIRVVKRVLKRYAADNWDFAHVIYNQGYKSVLRALNERYHPEDPQGMRYYVREYKKGRIKLLNPYPAMIRAGIKRIKDVLHTGKYPENRKKQSRKETKKPVNTKRIVKSSQTVGPVASVWKKR